jgi:hypothetical protein
MTMPKTRHPHRSGRGYRLIAMGETINLDSADPLQSGFSMSSAKDQEYFGDGIAEEIINNLTHQSWGFLPHVLIAFKGNSEDVRSIGKSLCYVRGSVRKKRTRPHCRPTNQNEDGCHLWSERYDRELRTFCHPDEIVTLPPRSKSLIQGKARSEGLRRPTEVTIIPCNLFFSVQEEGHRVH